MFPKLFINVENCLLNVIEFIDDVFGNNNVFSVGG